MCTGYLWINSLIYFIDVLQISKIFRAYETSKMYRELKMRGAIIDDEEKLKLLPSEEQINRLEGIWNLSSDQVLIKKSLIKKNLSIF